MPKYYYYIIKTKPS